VNIGGLLLGFLAYDALSKKSSSSSPPPPPPAPDPGAGKGFDAGEVGKLAGAGLGLVGTVLSGVVGGGGGTGATVGVGAGATTATVTTSSGSAQAAVETGVLAGEAIGLGGAFAFAWGVMFILQFVIINVVNAMRIESLRYRDKVFALNQPFLHLHQLELNIVEQVCQVLGLPYVTQEANDSALEGSVNGDDPRLTQWTRTAENGQQSPNRFRHWRVIVSNPFTGAAAAAKWRFVQMSARLIAARYVFDLGVFGRNFYRGWFDASWNEGWANTPLEVWAYPLVGGGQPDKTYAATHVEFQALGASVFDVDAALTAAHLSALLNVAALVVAEDPGVYSPIDWNPAGYSLRVYNAMGLSIANDGVSYAGDRWLFDVHKYGVHATSLWLNVNDLKAGRPMSPFLSAPAGVYIPTPASQTSLVAMP
jgi:hypothetical protein